ncbi:MAG TPA: META domain-containing protein [Pilimelia sp.]|nr:META domain-containing protein [Pilimelia sp.]
MATFVATALTVIGSVAAPTAAAADPSAEPQIWQRTFRSTAVFVNGESRELVAGTRIRIAFPRGVVTAGAGCGDIVGSAALAADRLVVAAMNLWFNGCADRARQNQDYWLAAFLSQDPTWRFDGAELVLADADTEIRLTDRPTVAADAALLDTYWVIEAVVEGDRVTPVPAFPQPYVVLRGTGELAAYDGCNWISGTAAVAGESVTLANVGSTKRLCANHSILLGIKIMAALDDGTVTARLDGGRLELSRPGGPGLRLRSES